MYVSTGVDRAGRAIIMNRKTPNPETDHARSMMQIVYTMERAILEMKLRRAQQQHQQRPPTSHPSEKSNKDIDIENTRRLVREYEEDTSCSQWLWILDMKHYSKGSSSPLHESKYIVSTLSSHYPERLWQGYHSGTPRFYHVFGACGTHCCSSCDWRSSCPSLDI